MIEIHRVNTFDKNIIMEMTDGGEVILSARAVDCCDGTAEILRIDGASFDMGKALLNAIDLMGIKKVVCKRDDMADVLKALRFQKADGMYVLDLTGYFVSGCKIPE